MSGSQDHFMEGTPSDQFGPKYTLYDNRYTGLQQNSDPSTPYEGFGFWYRPESQESAYNSDAAFTQQARSIPQPPMDMPLALKHKRTRSGCFTCRQRRVKVCQNTCNFALHTDSSFSAMKQSRFATVGDFAPSLEYH